MPTPRDPPRYRAADQRTGSPAATSQSFALPDAATNLAGSLTLADGAVVRVRAIRPDDTPRLRAFHAELSRATIVARFFHYMPQLSLLDADRFTHVDYESRMALLATTGADEHEQIIALVSYDRIAPDTAEVAFVVADRWQGRGIATALLLRLVPYARQRGFTTFVAFTMASNVRMLHVLYRCGYSVAADLEDDIMEVRLDISALPGSSPALAPLSFVPDADAGAGAGAANTPG
jgi:RimJ/RimL family protein N-acetyltransferase